PPTPEPEGYTLREDLRRAAAHRPYLLLNLAFFVCGFHVTFIATHLPSYVSDLGISERAGATALSLIGLFNIVGSLTAGALGGRYSKTKLLSLIYGLRAVFIAVYLLVPASAASTIVFGATFGLLWLSTVPLTGGIVTAQFGPRNSGALFGVVFLSHQLGAFVGVWLGGELADATGSYQVVWLIAMALGVMAAVVHLLIDEGPAPAPPAPAGGSVRLAPGGAVAALLLVVGVGALTTTTTAEMAGAVQASGDVGRAVESDQGVDGTLFCPLHPG
ncbi:MAG: MFS transporter, partial [Actinomycetota bacterium]